MRRVQSRYMMIWCALVFAALWAVSVSAQPVIPNGVFVRESNGQIWLVLDGQRVSLPVWQATDEQIASLPVSDRWAVMNEAGAMVSGNQPAWHAEQAAARAAAQAAAPQPTAAATPTESTARPTTSSSLVITEFTTYRASGGSETTYIVGILENQAVTPVAVRTIAVSLLGASGETIGGGTATDAPNVLPPGRRAPWRAVVSNAPAFQDVRIQVEGGPTDTYTARDVTHDLRVDGVTAQPRRGFTSAKIAGQVVNTGTETVGTTKILAAIFGSDGRLVDVRDAYSKLEALPPGQSSPFEVTFTSDRVNGPSRHELFVEARFKR